MLLQLEIDKRKKEKEQGWKADLRSLLHLEALIQLVWDETLNTLFPWQTIGSHKMEENETWSDRKRDKKGEENLFLLAFPLCISFFQQSHEKGWLFFHQSSGVSPFFGQVYLKISLIGYFEENHSLLNNFWKEWKENTYKGKGKGLGRETKIVVWKETTLASVKTDYFEVSLLLSLKIYFSINPVFLNWAVSQQRAVLYVKMTRMCPEVPLIHSVIRSLCESNLTELFNF